MCWDSLVISIAGKLLAHDLRISAYCQRHDSILTGFSSPILYNGRRLSPFLLFNHLESTDEVHPCIFILAICHVITLTALSIVTTFLISQECENEISGSPMIFILAENCGVGGRLPMDSVYEISSDA